MIIATIALYYGRQDVTRPVVSMYLDDLEDAGITYDQAVVAYAQYRRDPKNTRFPIPSNIMAILKPEISVDSQAQAASARIFQAIRKYGWCNAKEAQEFIGDLGWTTVSRMGGWMKICESVGVDYEIGTFMAQARQIAKSEAEYSKAGRHDEAPALPQPGNDAAIDALKMISMKNMPI
jgi:hypothetical protein